MFIGITGYSHESSAALIDEHGNLINFYREESLSRIKGDKSFPKRAIKKIFDIHNLQEGDIKSLAFYERPLTSFLTILKTAAMNMPSSLPLIAHQCRNFNKSSIACFLDISKLYPSLEKKLLYLDHHLSHTLNALSYSNIQNDLCSIVVDGFGDRSTISISKINSKYNINELWSCEYPASLGLFYSAITDFLGFQVNEGEYKVMGLSSFGNSNSSEAKKVYKLINWDKKTNSLIIDMSYFCYHISTSKSYSNKLVTLLGEPRNPFVPLKCEDDSFQYYANIARGAQDAVVDILCDLFEYAYKITDSKNFLFSGGLAMNSASLDRISCLPFVNKVIVPPSPGDAGSAIGAAFYAYLKTSSYVDSLLPKPKYFPSVFESKEQTKLAAKIISENFIVLSNKIELALPIAAELIKNGEVIGTIIGNAETGPRALGNRSLICDGTNHNAVKVLNTVIKNRSPFRPTAPCMKFEVAKKYYILREELIDCYSTMSATCKCKKDNLSLKFPTTHIDGTARLQIVEKGQFLYEMLDILENLQIEILANSSLNLSGDPTCFDLIDVLMVCARTPLKYVLTDFGLIQSKE